MSYFDDASLVMIPSGYKDQKVYSVKPIDGSGDLTFSRASNASRINSSGLVEKVRENLITYSEDLSNAAYTNDPTDGSITITANYGVAPNGTNTADRVQITKGTSYSQIYQAKSVTAGVEYSFSLYLKSLSGTPTITILYNENGAVGKATLTSSWVRYTFTYNAPLTSTNYPMIALYGGDSASCDILAWGLQFETGVPTDYIATTSSAVSVGATSGTPRLDYSGGASCPSALLEPQRSNALLQSENLSSATWTKDGGTITANATTSPDGYSNADLFTEDTSNGNHRVYQTPISTSANQPLTFSVFAKYNGRQYIYIRTDDLSNIKTAVFDIQNGTAGDVTSGATSKIQNYSNGWYRCSISLAATANAFTCEGLLGLLSGSSFSSATYTGDGTSGAYLWGFQGEVNASYATSYIPTLSTAETRVADAASKTGISTLLPSTEGTFFIDVDVNFDNSNFTILASTYVDGGSAFTQSAYFYINNNKVDGQIWNTPAFTGWTGLSPSLANGRHKLAISWKANDFVYYIDGSLVDSSTIYSAVPTGMNRLDVGDYYGGYGTNNKYNQLLIFKTRLSNADLATLTTI